MLIQTRRRKQHVHSREKTHSWFPDTSRLDRGANDVSGLKSWQQLRGWELCSGGKLQSDDPTSGCEHETCAPRANTTFEQPSTGV